MKDCLQIGKNQHLEPKEILRQRNGFGQQSEYLVKWNIVTQSTTQANQSDTSSSSGTKEDKSILIWMSKEEVDVCCLSLLGSGLSGLVGQNAKPPSPPSNAEDGTSISADAESEDFDDMKDDVQKLVIRARRQMKKTDSGETKPVKNISYTLKVLSTYASLGSLATVFRQTGALDLILELLWSKDVETRRHAGRMLKALASHDGGSRAYVLLSLIQDKHGQMTRSDDADFENRNMVMEMFAETSSGEEAHAVSLDFMQLPQIPGKSLFKLMKCYLKVSSLLDMDSQFGQLITRDHGDNTLKKEVATAKSNVAIFGERKYEVTMAITDLIYELCEVMGWNNKNSVEEIILEEDTAPPPPSSPSKPPAKAPPTIDEKDMAVFTQYKKEFSQFMDSLVTKDQTPDSPLSSLWTEIRKEMEGNETMVSQMLGMTFRRDILKDATVDLQARPLNVKPGAGLQAVVDDLKRKAGEKPSPKPKPATSLLEPPKSHCIFVSKHKDGLDQKLLAELIKNDTSMLRTSSTFREPTSFSSETEYEEYVRSMLRRGWCVKAIENNDEVKKGDEGIFERISSGSSSGNVAVYWFRLGSVHMVREKGIQILGKTKSPQANFSAKDVAKNMPDFLRNPETMKLWPMLVGQDVNKLSDHPYSSGLGASFQDLGVMKKPVEQKNLKQRQWWEILFFIQKMSPQTQLEAFTEIQKISGVTFPSGMELSISNFKDVIMDVYQVVKLLRHLDDFDSEVNSILKKSGFCSRFLKQKVKKKKDLKDQKVDNKDNVKSETTASTSVGATSNDDVPSTSKGLGIDFPILLAGPTKDKIHDYLIFICHQTSKFLDTFVTYKMLSTAFAGHNVPLEYFGEDAKADNALDHLPDFETKKRDHITAITFLHHILLKQLKTPFSSHTLNSVFFKLQPIPREGELDLCVAWMECIRIILDSSQGHASCKGAEVIVATSGCLVGVMRVLKWFPTCIESTMKAMKCMSLAMQAVKFHTSPGDVRSSESQIIRAVVDSIVSAADSSSSTDHEEKSELAAFFQSINFIMDTIDKLVAKPDTKGKVRWTDVESNTEVGALYEAVCICNFLITDQKELLKKSKDYLSPILKRIARVAPSSCPLSKITEVVKTKVGNTSSILTGISVLDFKRYSESLSLSAEDVEKPELTQEKLEASMEEFLDPDNFANLSNTMDKVLSFLISVLYNEKTFHTAPVGKIVNTLFPAVLFPNMCQKMNRDELSQTIDIIERVLFSGNSSSQTSVLSSVLEEENRPMAITTLVNLVETLSASQLRPNVDTANTTALKELVTKAMTLLQRIGEADRDSAVLMCGLDLKQYTSKAVEKYDSLPKAADLMQFLSGYERYRALHSKLLVVILGGTIGVALRCMEDARRMQDSLAIPLLDRLFASLCQGSDFDVKEDKCWERIEVSSNGRQTSKLTDGNTSTYWESNGSSGSHWINIHMKKGVVVRKVSVQISQDDSSYMPARFVVMGMMRPSDMSHQLNVVSVSTSDTKVTVLENEKKFWPIIRICIRRCQQGGIDTRIRGIEIIGPKPSFWPVLRQQLCVRTCLAYFVRAKAWISSCTKNDDLQQPAPKRRKLMSHGILKLSSRIIDAVRHEQEFADVFLPNDEASMVLGQAFRNAVINPLVEAVLGAGVPEENSGETTSLIFQLFSLYLDMSNPSMSGSSSMFEMEQIDFLARLRRLTRLLVDLNPSGAASIKRTKDSGIEKWRQAMQSKSSKDDDGSKNDWSKVPTSPSVRSLRHEALSGDKTKEIEAMAADDLLDPTQGTRSWTPGLAPLASQWCSVVTTRLQEFLNQTLVVIAEGEKMNVFSKSGEQFCQVLSKEYECIRSCTAELFGTSVHFVTKLVKGIAMAVASLDINRTITFGRNVAVTIHELLMRARKLHMTQNDLKMLNHVVEFLFLSNGLDWGCIFEPLYCTLLASRLLNYEVPSIELERQICSVLRACFPDGRPGLMLQDASHSLDLWKGFISHRMETFDTLTMWASSDNISEEQRHSLHCTLEENWKKYRLYKSNAISVQVLSPVAWRLRATQKKAVPDLLRQLNSGLLSILEDYESYFKSAYHHAVSPNGSRTSGPLHWTGEGWAEVLDTATGQTYKVTTVQMLLLLHFDSDNQCPIDISSWRKAFPHHWELALQSLIEANIIIHTSNDSIVLYAAIETKTPRDEVLDVTSYRKEEAMALSKMSDAENLTEKRNAIIDCAIVHCIKKKPCQMDTLIFNVVKHCLGEPNLDSEKSQSNDDSKHFYPLSTEVISRCELLLDLGYIKREPENPQMMQYVPEVAPIRSRAPTVTVEQTTPVKEEPKILPAVSEREKSEAKVTENETVDLEIAREIIEENIEDDDEDVWETAESSSTVSTSSATKKISSKSGAIPKVPPKKVEETKTGEAASGSNDVLFPYSELASWHLVHGMSNNPTVITLRKSCQSLTKEQVFRTIVDNVKKLSAALFCEESVIEALLLEMDWRQHDLIDHYTTNKLATLRSIGITETGEQPTKEKDFSEIGAASSSTSTESSTENFCPVCICELDPADSLALDCGHRCCNDCWRTYLTQKLDENQAVNTTCPVSKCEVRPSLKTYMELFKDDGEKLERYKTALVRSYVESSRSLSWCHCPIGCEMVIRKGSSWQNVGTCANCGWETCFACTYTEAHYPASCGHMSQWLEDGGYYEGMGEDARSKHLARLIAKRCPKCQANIEKDDGCLHMKCLKCSHDFCWRCLKDWRPTHRDYYKCSAKVSKLAQAGMKFQEHNTKCQYHHKAKAFPLEILRRLMTVDATAISTVNLLHAIRSCAYLIKARKTLAYCNVFNYYSVDTERMKTMELHSQVLESNTLQLQEFLSKILLSVADITNSVANIKESDRIILEELNSKIRDHLKSILLFSAQDMKVGMPGDKSPVGNNESSVVQSRARPAGMSDDDDDHSGRDPFEVFQREHTGWGAAVGRFEPVIRAWDDDDDRDEGNFPSSEDTFSHDDDDDDDDDDDSDDDNSDDMILDDTLGDSDIDIFDEF